MNKSLNRGFTLLEAVLTIVITGILAGMVAVFIKAPVDSYTDTVRRANLTDAADGALRRIARDIHAALPNSLRSTSPASNNCVEFLPVVGGGRYRVAPSINGLGDILDFSAVDSSFDVIAATNLPDFSSGASYHAVIYNLGIFGADAYDTSGFKPIRAAIKSSTSASNIELDVANQFPFESPGKRFHVISNYSVVYSCDMVNRELIRSTRAITSEQLSSCPESDVGDVLMSNISACSFTYTPAVSQRNGLLTMRLGLEKSGESIQLYQEVHVNNVP
jgi:MSHA biogenesis protein MshO